ncbi:MULTISPECIES: TetR/AcrR family transcriptional regulator [unclassified Streptomyces]|uniref:TetR/AcrR family transcriptional regulator n=1 Tax=unclassified Streptomyces TaxID=2593676 RepID=UPI000DBA7533|nr:MULTISPECIES: TetR/AcrR family transcriptional regulator [unclassified Streptomyces]MYT73534.1 TetR family transcriptional regulator [Streptomyces sp. SID8367]RAJ85070.1 TetR family transcriptional regulator [Streptomyces sp. PsTaAH-137]
MDDPSKTAGSQGARRSRGKPRSQPRPGLTPEVITRASRELIEREGLDALSMRAVAAELGTAATSLYRHVADRDALLVAILEDIAAQLPVEVAGDTPGARLFNRLVTAHGYMAQHVWVLHILIRGELVARNALPFSDACLADFLSAGLGPRRASTAFRTCWHFTIGELLDEHPLTPPRSPNQRQQAMASFDPDRLPALARVRELDEVEGRDTYATALKALLGAFLPES